MRPLLLIVVAACGFHPNPLGTGSGDDAGAVDAAIGDANQMVGPCASPGVLRDNFDAPGAAPLWFVDTQGGTVVEQNGRLLVTPTGTSFTGYISKHYVDLTGAAIEVEVPEMLDTATMATAEIFVEADITHFVAISQQHGMLIAEQSNGPGPPTVAKTPYDATAHRFWRISESGGQVHFEASPDGQTWASLLMAPTPPFATAMRIDLGVNGDPAMASGSVAFDNLNTQVPTATWCKAATLHDMFNRNNFGLAWANHYTSGGGCAPSVNNGAHLDQNGQPSVCYLGTSRAFDLTSSAAVTTITAITSYKPGWYTYVSLASDDGRLANLTFDNNQLCAQIDTGPLICRAYVQAESFWRVREAGGMLTFEASTDQLTWDPVNAIADPFDLTAVEVRVGTLSKIDLSANHIGLTVSGYN